VADNASEQKGTTTMGGDAKIVATAAGAQQHLQDLRGTLDWLKARGDLVETDKEVNPDIEVTGLQKLMDGGCPVVFNNVKGKPNRTTRSARTSWRARCQSRCRLAKFRNPPRRVRKSSSNGRWTLMSMWCQSAILRSRRSSP
jgi:hypothetical protein